MHHDHYDDDDPVSPGEEGTYQNDDGEWVRYSDPSLDNSNDYSSVDDLIWDASPRSESEAFIVMKDEGEVTNNSIDIDKTLIKISESVEKIIEIGSLYYKSKYSFEYITNENDKMLDWLSYNYIKLYLNDERIEMYSSSETCTFKAFLNGTCISKMHFNARTQCNKEETDLWDKIQNVYSVFNVEITDSLLLHHRLMSQVSNGNQMKGHEAVPARDWRQYKTPELIWSINNAAIIISPPKSNKEFYTTIIDLIKKA